MSASVLSWGEGKKETETPSDDEVFEILSNRRRRLVLRVLRDRDEPINIRELSEAVAALEHDVAPEEVTYRQRKSVYTSLHQNHLARMREAGIVTSDRQWENVRLADSASTFITHLGYERDRTGSSNDLYLFLSLFSGFNLSMAVFGIYPWSALSPRVYAMLTVVLFLSAALFQRWWK